jgi:hypothetical protein
MRSEEVELKIREAVALGRGDKQAAARVLLSMCDRDERLLRELVKPFLSGILFHAVERLMKTMSPADLRSKAGPKPAKPQEVPKDMLDKLVDALGQNIPVGKPRAAKTKSGDPDEAIRMVGIGPGDIPPPDAGERHQRAIKTVASSFKWKGK